MSRYLCLSFLSIAIFCLSIEVKAQSAQEFVNEGIHYTSYANGSWMARVTGSDDGVTEIRIPASVSYNGYDYPVTQVGANAFKGRTDITLVEFGSNITTASDYSFSGCTGLTSITFGTGMTTVGQYAFQNCNGLQTVTVDKAFTQFKYGAFIGCNNLEKVIYEGDINGWVAISVQNSNADANPLGKAHNLYINGELVTNLTGLTATSIEAYKFQGATCLNGRLDIPSQLTKIGQNAFMDCTNINGVNFLGTVDEWMQREIGGTLLKYAGGNLYIQGELLTELTIGTDVTQIANNAFQGVSCIKGRVVVPENVTRIGWNAFTGCTGITDFIIGNGVTYLGSTCFSGCSALENVVIGNNVPKIDIYTFQNCSSLKSITMGEKVTEISDYSFQGCSALSSVPVLPSGLTSIGRYAFDGCADMKGDLELPEGITTIQNDAFNGCASLTSVKLGKNITTIGSQAFKGCSGLKGSLVIPESVTSLAGYVFQNCSGLESVEIQCKLKEIPSYLFAGCSSLEGTVVIPDGVTSIGSNAFQYCSKVSSFELPSTLKTIGNYAFQNCESWEGELIIPEGVTTLNTLAFSRCYALTKVILPQTLRSIGSSPFAYCTGLTGNLVIPNTVTSIGMYAFQECTGLTSLELGSGLTSMSYSFYNCTGLTQISISATTPPNINTQTFAGVNKEIPLHVPSGSETAYKEAVAWKEFVNINPVYPTSFSLSTSSNTIKGIGNAQIEVTFEPLNTTYRDLIWTTSDADIATVSDKGIVTGVKRGIATITATSAFDDNLTASIEIIVQPYTLTYEVEGEEYEVKYYDYGQDIEDIETPNKEGHTFAEWENLPATMPAEDLTVTALFTLNDYTVTFIVDEEEYKIVLVGYGNEIPLPENPEKEGHSFKGWNGLPSTMPANDISVSAIFDINSYQISYYVDGELYNSQTWEYGAEILPLEEPEKEGYTFSGWSDMPKDMPALNFDVYGFFTVNTYTVYFYIDGTLYTKVEVDFGSPITLPDIVIEDDTREFGGWETTIPSTMAAGDLEIYGFTQPKSVRVDKIYNDGTLFDVYTLNGTLIRKDVTKEEAVKQLASGVYILKNNIETIKIKL